jgi:hypothetical protein
MGKGWLAIGDARMGVGLICGTISDGLCCLDADHADLAAWILEHHDHPLFVGCWIVETGSGKAHVWIRSRRIPRVHAWYVSPGVRAGEVRGEGSYAAAPPSLHPSGKTYVTRAGSIEQVGVHDDVEKLALAITQAYLNDNPGAAPAPPSDRSYRVLAPSAEERADAASRVRQAGFKRKITETLLKPDNADPGKGHWIGVGSHSEIDFAIVMEMVRKGWERDEAEWIFAGTLAASNCYANGDRHGSRGRAYWITTWTNAEAEHRREQAAALVATGGNFKVTRVVKLGRRVPQYRISLQINEAGAAYEGTITMSGSQMAQEANWLNLCLDRLGAAPVFLSGQRGVDFRRFTMAVIRMTSDTLDVPRETSDTGYRESIVLATLRSLPEREPAEMGEMGLGWKKDGYYHLRARAMVDRIRSHDHAFKASMLLETLDGLGSYKTYYYAFSDGQTEEMLRLKLRPSHAALPPGGDDDDS